MLQAALALAVLPFLVDAFKRSGLGWIDLVDLVIWMALTVFVLGALSLSVSLPEGVSLSYSGAAFLALTLGYSRALLSMTLLVIITQPLSLMGQTLLLDALFPVWLMVTLVGCSRRLLPANPFVFLLGIGFFGLFVVYAVQQMFGAAIKGLISGEGMLAQLFSEQTIWNLLLAGGEATLEGMIITLLVVYFPRAVVLFDDGFYLKPR